MEYTKGEWKIYRDSMVAQTGVVSEDGIGFFNRSIAEIVCNDDSTLEEIEANAHLIAAAPKLYEVCKYLAEHGWNASVTEDAQEAIDKAEGG